MRPNLCSAWTGEGARPHTSLIALQNMPGCHKNIRL
jgi:hypothetical protein